MANRRKCECGSCSLCRHREYMRDWYWRNRDKVCETARETRMRHLEKIRERDRARGYRPGNPVKVAARYAVHAAIDDGTLVRLPCEMCGDPKTDAHHDDYSRPLDVRWLCRRHHGEAHRQPLPAPQPGGPA